MHLFYRKIYKRITALVLGGVLAFGSAAQAMAVNLDPESTPTVQSTSVKAAGTEAVVPVAQTTDSIALDGAQVQPQAYKINSENYFKLRDVAYLLRNTSCKFNVEWDKAANSIRLTTGQEYVKVGGEMSYASGKSAVLSSAGLLVNGSKATMTAYNIGGNTYFRLRDISREIGFTVGYNDTTDTVEMESIRYKVTFTMNGVGAQAAPVTGIKPGSKITAPKVAEIAGYALSGWYKDSACKTAWNFSSDTVNKNLTLYAKWVKTYTVEFEMNGLGTQVATQKGVPENSLLTEPKPTADGYTFAGWYTERQCYTQWNFSSNRVSTDLVLYANWVKKDSPVAEDGSDTSGGGTTSSSRVDGTLTILIDAGHGGSDDGAGSVEAGVYEKDICLQVARKLQTLLESSGVKVLMTRTADTSLPASKRTPYISNNAKSLDLIVCIHQNSADNATARGSEMLVPSSAQESSGESKRIASLFLQQYIALGLNNRGIKERPNLYMIKAAVAADVPIAFSEYCFLSNSQDYALVSTDTGLQTQAQAMYNAIMTYFQDVSY